MNGLTFDIAHMLAGSLVWQVSCSSIKTGYRR